MHVIQNWTPSIKSDAFTTTGLSALVLCMSANTLLRLTLCPWIFSTMLTTCAQEASSFVLALIDGDGAVVSGFRWSCLLSHLTGLQFQDALLGAAAIDGGSEAASRLHHEIRNHVALLYTNSGNWPVMVQVYLSLDKLSEKLARVGLLRSPVELRFFAQRFSVNQPLFSIIDVGQGKERADHKIKGMCSNNWLSFC
jgi:hypothetical protein